MYKDKIVAYMISEAVNQDTNIRIISDSNRCVKFEADLQDTSEWNRNKRKYPTDVVKKGLMRENVQEPLANGDWCGEAGHPIDPTLQRQMTVFKPNISHRILSFKFNGPKVHGVLKTYPSDIGRTMRDVILDTEDPTTTAFSLRAMGPVKQTSQGNIVQDPLTVVTYDWVTYPSHRKAYQSKIIGITPQGNSSLAESTVLIPLMESSALDYIKEESKNFKLVSDVLEFSNKNIALSEDCHNVILTEKNGNTTDKLILGVESYISNEITDYFDKFK